MWLTDESGIILTNEYGVGLTTEQSLWGARIATLFPWRRWSIGFSAIDVSQSPDKNGVLGALLYGLAGGPPSSPSGFPLAWKNLQYVKGEMRFATMTDTVDQAGLDMFAGVVPRAPLESYSAYASRLVLTMTAPNPSIPGLTTILQAYINALNLGPKQTQTLATDVGQGGLDTQGAVDRITPIETTPTQLLATDTQGALDTFGFTDEPSGNTAPTVYVFDATSDPTLSAQLGVTDPEFGIALLYPGVATTLLQVTGPFSPAFDAMVRTFKGPGFPPVYASNNP